ncbi:hypothetical protein Y1Q_0002011 [Alligator mississippiensis]|uniref:Uncharacterized protein n=1 Tax=Alligator mississippiensis TaxID=8496 RepID=A0A151MP09_ALLMI|nr:hypothetical protein Y1Q_0002011 [Alligator mississippiensis]
MAHKEVGDQTLGGTPARGVSWKSRAERETVIPNRGGSNASRGEGEAIDNGVEAEGSEENRKIQSRGRFPKWLASPPGNGLTDGAVSSVSALALTDKAASSASLLALTRSLFVNWQKKNRIEEAPSTAGPDGAEKYVTCKLKCLWA